MSIFLKILRFCAACAVVATIIWMFYLTQITISHLNFMQGVEVGLSQCRATGVVEPEGVAQAKGIETPLDT